MPDSGFVDTDGDDIDDHWEKDVFGDLLTAEANTDWDLDHFSDHDESWAGTNAKDNTSWLGFIAPPTRSGTTCTVRWQSVAGKRYSLWRTGNLAAWPGTPLAGNIEATQPTNTYEDTPPTPTGPWYYRVSTDDTAP